MGPYREISVYGVSDSSVISLRSREFGSDSLDEVLGTATTGDGRARGAQMNGEWVPLHQAS